jgi:hypothetical protein
MESKIEGNRFGKCFTEFLNKEQAIRIFDSTQAYCDRVLRIRRCQ